ncbi:MAG: ABC transporter ATP-binding protein [Verrucomicrobiae bacterium]|nr:ABC transporter ATP-binding protein [Verrucomicrobiae bacterium]
MPDSDLVIRARHVSKKYCRGLRRSLWYGLRDIASEALGTLGSHDRLRPDEFWAVNDVSFELQRGECLGLIGHNGAGKTTLLKMLNGLLKPDRGQLALRGQVGALIALGAGFNPILSGRENIYVNGAILGRSRTEIEARLDDIIDYADLREFIDAPVRSYSSGMHVRLGFAVAVAFRPDILLLDEVLAVGDVGFQARCFNTLSAFRAAGTAFILVSHNMHQIQRYCDRVLHLSHGRVGCLGPTSLAIDAYHREMAARAPAPGDGNDFSTPNGSGRVRLTSAHFLNSHGQPVERLRSGQPLTLRLDFDCPSPPVTGAVLDVLIRDREGIFFQGTNLDRGGPLDPLPASGSLEVAFDSLPANATDLHFFVALLDGHTREVFDWKRNLRLEVLGNPASPGRVLLPCHFAVRSRHG